MIDGLALSNKALTVVTLKPFHERTAPEAKAPAIIADLRRQFSQIVAANIIPFNLPPIMGLGTGSGFEYQLLDLTGGGSTTFGAVARGMMAAAIIGVFLITGLYRVYQEGREKAHKLVSKPLPETIRDEASAADGQTRAPTAAHSSGWPLQPGEQHRDDDARQSKRHSACRQRRITSQQRQEARKNRRPRRLAGKE